MDQEDTAIGFFASELHAGAYAKRT
jgi:hypothetical protein